MQTSNGSEGANGGAAGRSARLTLVILIKELREIFRDKRTIISVVISPLIVTPGLMALVGMMVRSQTDKAHERTYDIGIVGSAYAPGVVDQLERLPNVQVHLLNDPVEKAETQIRRHRLDAVVVLPPEAGRLLSSGRAVPIRVLEDAGSDISQQAAGRLNAALTQIGEKVVAERLSRNHLPPEYATPFHVANEPIPQGGSVGTFLLAMMLPYLLAISCFSGAIYAAFDQVAGEKERGTLETLLVSPASRRNIVLGKFGAVVVVCLINSILAIVGLVVPFATGAAAFTWLSKGGLHISPIAVIVTLLVLLPLSILFAGLLLTVSTFARNQKEAQTYLAPLFMVVLLPALASVFVGADVSRLVALIPILNVSIIIKQALSGNFDPVFILLAFVVSAAYAALSLTVATRLFQKESVLIKA